MKPLTQDELYEYRIKNIIKRVLKDTGAEVKDFPSTNALLDYLFSKDIAKLFGQAVAEDMTEWTDDWLEQLEAE